MRLYIGEHLVLNKFFLTPTGTFYCLIFIADCILYLQAIPGRCAVKLYF